MKQALRFAAQLALYVPLMALIAVVSTFAYRRTASHLPGALLSGGLVAWYVVVGQATQTA